LESKTQIPSTILTVSELLAQYEVSQSKLQSFIAKGKSTIERNIRKEETTCEFRFDGDRVSHRIDFHQPVIYPYKSFLWDGQFFVEYRQAARLEKSEVFVKKDDLSKKKLIATEYNGAALMGICSGDYERIDLILGKADKISLRDKTDKIDKSECYVIDAGTRRGKYTVWIDPEHGYNIAKIEVQRKKGYVVFDQARANADMSFSLKDVRFEKIKEVWVPMEADIEETRMVNRKDNIIEWHHKRTEMALNPDHNALGSFVADDIQDGTKVTFSGRSDTTEYIWKSGGPVVK
jgi:hypothetical protein